MKIKEKRIILNIILKIILILTIITLDYFVVNNNRIINHSETSSVAIIGGADGPTTIYISSKNVLVNILIYLLSLLFIIDIITLLIYDIISLIKDKKYSIKYKCKIIFSIDFFIILSVVIKIIFTLLG
ncbi:MAG: sodium ion-translocating decarboxylase subunit beta [Spirochaetaceae bacterium]|nr:sodium ion-translocating decarboxylase subunit beta [Spirochaetaceae bacterium]